MSRRGKHALNNSRQQALRIIHVALSLTSAPCSSLSLSIYQDAVAFSIGCSEIPELAEEL